MYDHIYVVGNGKTTRANVEALIDDYIYANPKVKFHLYSLTGLSEAQIWLKQYLEDQKIEFDVTIRQPVEKPEPGSVAYFILWSDEDPESSNLLAVAKEYECPAFDLTNGLTALTAVENIKVIESPEIPKQEQIVEPSHPAVESVDEPVEYVEDTFEDIDPLYGALDYIAQYIAKAVAKELKAQVK